MATQVENEPPSRNERMKIRFSPTEKATWTLKLPISKPIAKPLPYTVIPSLWGVCNVVLDQLYIDIAPMPLKAVFRSADSLAKSAFVITLSLSRYAVPLSWIPRVCVFAGERRDVLYVDCAMTSPKLLFQSINGSISAAIITLSLFRILNPIPPVFTVI